LDRGGHLRPAPGAAERPVAEVLGQPQPGPALTGNDGGHLNPPARAAGPQGFFNADSIANRMPTPMIAMIRESANILMPLVLYWTMKMNPTKQPMPEQRMATTHSRAVKSESSSLRVFFCWDRRRSSSKISPQ